MDPNGVNKKDMPNTEKILLWKHINYFDDDVEATTLELISHKNVLML